MRILCTLKEQILSNNLHGFENASPIQYPKRDKTAFCVVTYFYLKYSLTVKNDEAKRLESEVRAEETALQRMESELRLAEQAFDQFLQENDRKAIAAMKRFENHFSPLHYESLLLDSHGSSSICVLKKCTHYC